MNPNTRIFVAGHRGLAGSAILRALHAKGYANTIVRKHGGTLDLQSGPEGGTVATLRFPLSDPN